MREKLRQDLLNQSIIDLVGYDDNLEPKIYFLHAPESTSGNYIEYEIYDEQGAFYEENEPTATTYYIQVDIYSPGSYSALEKAVKDALRNKGYDGGYGPDLYDNTTKLNHKPLRFTYTEILE
jgi:hypothetical protein